MNKSLQKIADHFTDQSQAQVFKGFDENGKGITELEPSPLSFEHDDESHFNQKPDPLMSHCNSCGIVARCNQFEYMTEEQQRDALEWIKRTATRVFLDEDPEAAEEICELVEELLGEQ